MCCERAQPSTLTWSSFNNTKISVGCHQYPLIRETISQPEKLSSFWKIINNICAGIISNYLQVKFLYKCTGNLSTTCNYCVYMLWPSSIQTDNTIPIIFPALCKRFCTDMPMIVQKIDTFMLHNSASDARMKYYNMC